MVCARADRRHAGERLGARRSLMVSAQYQILGSLHRLVDSVPGTATSISAADQVNIACAGIGRLIRAFAMAALFPATRQPSRR